MPLTIFGGVALDYVEGQETDYGPRLGGSATFAAMAAAPLTDVHLVGVVGDDFPADGFELFEGAGVDSSGVTMRPGPTARWWASYGESRPSRRTTGAAPGVSAHFVPRLPASHGAWGALMLGAADPAVQVKVRLQASADVLVGVDTIDHWIEDDGTGVRAALAAGDVAFIGRGEAVQLTGHREPEAIASDLGLGPEQVMVVKGGRAGSWLCHGDRRWHVPSFPVATVVDPTGAGDAYAGAFMAYLSRSEDRLLHNRLRGAMVRGTAAASIAIEGPGLEPLIGLREEQIEERAAVVAATI